MPVRATLAVMVSMFLRAEFARPLPPQCVQKVGGYVCQVVDIAGIVVEHRVRDGFVIGLSVRSTDDAVCTALHAEYAKRFGTCMRRFDQGTTACWDSSLVQRRWSDDSAVCSYEADLAELEQSDASWPTMLRALRMMNLDREQVVNDD